MIRELALGAAGALACICTAFAHVTLETREASIGAPYKAVLRVAHGCEGTAYHALRVRIPEGVIAVKPMPKPGWKHRHRQRQVLQDLQLLSRRQARARA